MFIYPTTFVSTVLAADDAAATDERDSLLGKLEETEVRVDQ